MSLSISVTLHSRAVIYFILAIETAIYTCKNMCVGELCVWWSDCDWASEYLYAKIKQPELHCLLNWIDHRLVVGKLYVFSCDKVDIRLCHTHTNTHTHIHIHNDLMKLTIVKIDCINWNSFVDFMRELKITNINKYGIHVAPFALISTFIQRGM